MKFFADENIARAIIVWLRGKGHDVLYASEVKPGASDEAWLTEAQEAERLVFTSDKDFGELIFATISTIMEWFCSGWMN